MALTIEQRIFIIEYFFIYLGSLNLHLNKEVSNTKVIEKCQYEYERRYNTKAPSPQTVINIVNKFKETGSLEIREYKRKPTVLTGKYRKSKKINDGTRIWILLI